MRRFVLCLLAAACLAASACSLGERTSYAARLVRSPGRAAKAGTAVGTMHFDLTAQVRAGAAEAGGAAVPAGAANGAAASVAPPPPGDLPVVIDFKQQAASLSVAQAGGAPEPVIVLQGTKVYVRRASTSGVSSRRWVVLDLAKLEKITRTDGSDVAERTGLVLVAFPGPLQLIELIAGSLTGSAERVRPNTYTANLSREKADRELRLSDDAKEQRADALTLVAVVDEVQPATITLDDDGRPTALEVQLKPRLSRDLKVSVRVQTQLKYQPARVQIPARDDTLALETQGQLLGELANLNRALLGGAAARGRA